MKNKKVVAIFYADARNLSGVKRIGTEVTSVPDDVWNEIDIEVPADLQITSKIEDKNEIFSAKLVFRELCSSLRYRHIAAYKVRLADGSEMLIGNSERPYPVLTKDQNLSSGNSNSQLRELTVTYSDFKDIPYII